MIERKKGKTVQELFGNVIVFGKDNKVCYAGVSIKKSLLLGGTDIQHIVDSDFSGTDGKNILSAIDRVRREHSAFTFKFSNSHEHFYLFPINGTDGENVILAVKSEIDRVNKIERDLRERVKELQCLYSISREIEVTDTIDEAIQASTEHIRQGFQFPEVTSVVVDYNGKKYLSKGAVEGKAKNVLSDEHIMKNSRKRGEIKVIYHKKLPFLKEEVNLIREISRKFTKAIEREERERLNDKQKKILLSKNTKLLELTEDCRQSREQLQTFFKAIKDTILVIDNDYNIVLSNNDSIGNAGKCYKKLFNLDNVCRGCPANLTFGKGKINSLETDHSNQFFKLRTYPIYDTEGKVDRVLEVCRNVTKEKKMESSLLESHKLASLGKLVAGVAHEINNPNTFILGNTKIIKEAFSDALPILDKEFISNPELKIARLNYVMFKDNVTTLIDDVYNGAVKIKKIVEELRNYAKRDDDLLTDSVSINNLVENTLRLVKKQIKENININVQTTSEIQHFPGNISRLEQVLINLLLNASQAIGTENGEITVKTVYDSDNNHVILIVSDSGKGMDEETLKSVFDPFFTTKRNEGGIGLGLSISYRIIKEHKGDIDIESSPGKGTTFTITIPVNTSDYAQNSNN